MRISVALVEDDTFAVKELESYLIRFGKQSGNSFCISHFMDGKTFLQNYQPRYEIIFMDIKMPGIDGMSAAEQLRKTDSETMLIFVTSMVQYAVQSYDVDAFDFIAKPLNYAAFEMKMKRVFRALKLKYGSQIMLNLGGGTTRKIPSSSIYYIEVMNHDLTYHTDQGTFTVRGKLSSVMQQLPPASFFRSKSSYLINLRYVTQVTTEEVCVAGDWLRVSRTKRKELITAVAAYLGQGV